MRTVRSARVRARRRPPATGRCCAAQDWIHDKLVEREKCRMRRDFGTADAIREELFKSGVEIWESHGERMWRARDGRSGPRPNHEGKYT